MKCCTCKNDKPLEEFSINHSRPSGYQHRCKECVSKNNKEKSLEIALRCGRYYKKNSSKIKATSRKYYTENKEKCLASRKVYVKNKRQNDPVFRLRQCVSHQVRQNIKKQAGIKRESIFKYLPYTLEELKSHFENQFEPWMTWDNYGGKTFSGPKTWWIDHIIPQSRLPYNSMKHPNFLICWDLGNLRPLKKH